jgi:hypothetical protein
VLEAILRYFESSVAKGKGLRLYSSDFVAKNQDDSGLWTGHLGQRDGGISLLHGINRHAGSTSSSDCFDCGLKSAPGYRLGRTQGDLVELKVRRAAGIAT